MTTIRKIEQNLFICFSYKDLEALKVGSWVQAWFSLKIQVSICKKEQQNKMCIFCGRCRCCLQRPWACERMWSTLQGGALWFSIFSFLFFWFSIFSYLRFIKLSAWSPLGLFVPKTGVLLSKNIYICMHILYVYIMYLWRILMHFISNALSLGNDEINSR